MALGSRPLDVLHLGSFHGKTHQPFLTPNEGSKNLGFIRSYGWRDRSIGSSPMSIIMYYREQVQCTSQNTLLNPFSHSHALPNKNSSTAATSFFCGKSSSAMDGVRICWAKCFCWDSWRHHGKLKHVVPVDKDDWSSRWRNPADTVMTTVQTNWDLLSIPVLKTIQRSSKSSILSGVNSVMLEMYTQYILPPNHWRDCVSTWPASSASAPCMESLPHKGPTGSGLAPSSWPVSLGEGCPFDPGSLAIFERKIFQICVHAIYIYTCITYYIYTVYGLNIVSLARNGAPFGAR